jgi:hypothetical protein
MVTFDRDVFLDKHRRNERWLRQARNELDRSLNDRCIGGVGRYEAQTYQEYKHQVDNEKAKMIPQLGVSLTSLNRKNTSQNTEPE